MKEILVKILLSLLLVGGILVIDQIAHTTETPDVQTSALVNVVLVEVDTNQEAVLTRRFETENWGFWEEKAPRLLNRLEGELGRVRSTGGSIAPEASLYSIRCAAQNLEDRQSLHALTGYLEEVSSRTSRPSLLVIWMLEEWSVMLGSLNLEEKQVDYALAVLSHIQPIDSRQPSGVSMRAIVPPCVLATGSSRELSQRNSAILDQILGSAGIDSLSHCLVLGDYTIAGVGPSANRKLASNSISMDHKYSIDGILPNRAPELPVGTTIQTVVVDIPGINNAGATRPDKWGPVLTGSEDFVRYNIRHHGMTAGDWPQEPGKTITLPKSWDPNSTPEVLAQVVADIKSGKNVFVKIDQNIKTEGYFIGGEQAEGQWVTSVANWIADQTKMVRPEVGLVANLHSKGTIDGLSLNWKSFDGGIISSPRNSVNDWSKVVDTNPTTKFLFITGDRDLPHGIERGFLSFDRPNVVVLNEKTTSLNPFIVHGQVTDPSFSGYFDCKLGGKIQTVQGNLGDLVRGWSQSQIIPDEHIAKVSNASSELESLQKNVDRFYDVVKTLYKMADIRMPYEMKVPLAFASPVMGDLRFKSDVKTSQSLERLGKFGISEIPDIIATLESKGKLPSGYLSKVAPFLSGAPDIVAAAASQSGRGATTPSVAELTRYLDGVNKACWATVGALIASPGGPAAIARGASIGSTMAGLGADIARGMTYTSCEKDALEPVIKQMIKDFEFQRDAAVGHGVQAKTFSEMFTSQEVNRLHIPRNLVADLDASATIMNNSRSSSSHPTSFSAPDIKIGKPDPPYIPKLKKPDDNYPYFVPPPRRDPLPGIGKEEFFRPGGGGALVRPIGNPLGDGGSAMPRFSGPSEPALRALFPTLSKVPIGQISSGATAKPGGILFDPEIEVVADRSGLTSAKATQAVKAVKGKAGGEFQFEGRQFLAVKAPGTAKRVQTKQSQNIKAVAAEKVIPLEVGHFHLSQQDMSIRSSNGSDVVLNRYYDSGSKNDSPLGKGWTFLPFSLRVDETTKTGNQKRHFAKRPVLVDNEKGIEMPYQLELRRGKGGAVKMGGKDLPQFRPIATSFQPLLVARADGGYVAVFAHGLQAAFDSEGKLEWIGTSEAAGVVYVFSAGVLTEVTSKDAKIVLNYDQGGALREAIASNGQRVTYSCTIGRRLTRISNGLDGSFSFGYDNEGRVCNIERLEDDGKRILVLANEYDARDRMLLQKTISGTWKYQYHDKIACAILTKPSGNNIFYYYGDKQQLLATGSNPDDMTLFNYDITGRICQVAKGKLLNDPSRNEKPRFKVLSVVTAHPTES